MVSNHLLFSSGDIISRHDSLERNVQFATPLVVSYDEEDEEFFREIDELLAGSKAQIKQAYCELQERQRNVSTMCMFYIYWLIDSLHFYWLK